MGFFEPLALFRKSIDFQAGGDGCTSLYRLLVEAMQQGVAVLNPEGALLYCNPCLADLFKIPVEKVTGGTVDGFVAEADRAILTDMLWKV